MALPSLNQSLPDQKGAIPLFEKPEVKALLDELRRDGPRWMGEWEAHRKAKGKKKREEFLQRQAAVLAAIEANMAIPGLTPYCQRHGSICEVSDLSNRSSGFWCTVCASTLRANMESEVDG